MTGHDLPAGMRASDADRDAVVSDLGEHFQAGRLTAAELDERIGQALSARTLGELTGLLTDLPARSGRQLPAASSAASPSRSSSRRIAPPLVPVLGALAVAGLVLAVACGGWGLLWLLVPAMLIARRSVCSSGALGHGGRRY